MNGTARVGIDDFVRKIVGQLDGVELPKLNKEVRKGELLFSFKRDSRTIDISSPLSGKITLLNAEHIEHPEWIASKPFELSWMCCIEPSNLAEELHSLKIGVDTINWYREEIEKYTEIAEGMKKGVLPIESSSKGDDKAGRHKADGEFLEKFAKTFLSK
jgi:glycine cleavage system H protein